MSEEEKSELKPCPFCGNEVHLEEKDFGDYTFYRIFCDTWECWLEINFENLATKNEILSFFNKRA